ncbi:MAG: ABC transporter permease subunit, partial [Roseococcus sp.]
MSPAIRADGPGIFARLGGIGMALIALLPLLMLAGFAITEAVRAYRANEEMRLRDAASLVAAAVDARLGSYVTAMTTLSLAPSLRRDDDHASFHQRAVAVGALLGGDVMLFGPPPDFELHASSGLPLDVPMPTNPRRDERLILERAASQAATERRPIISDVFLNYAGQSGIAVLAGFSAVMINILRGIPIIVQLFYIYFVMPDFGLSLTAVQAAIIGLGIAYSAYQAENFRAG